MCSHAADMGATDVFRVLMRSTGCSQGLMHLLIAKWPWTSVWGSDAAGKLKKSRVCMTSSRASRA